MKLLQIIFALSIIAIIIGTAELYSPIVAGLEVLCLILFELFLKVSGVE
jgi:hypothetical protein